MNHTLTMLTALLFWPLAALHAADAPIAATASSHPTDWFCKARYGVFVHYLHEIQNDPATVQSLGRKTTWDECVCEFDVDRFADAMAQAGAGYVIFTMHQRTSLPPCLPFSSSNGIDLA